MEAKYHVSTPRKVDTKTENLKSNAKGPTLEQNLSNRFWKHVPIFFKGMQIRKRQMLSMFSLMM